MLLVKDGNPCSLHKIIYVLQNYFFIIFFLLIFIYLFIFLASLSNLVLVTQSCPTLCNPTGCSLSASSSCGIFQASILEWVAISFSRGSSWPKGWTQVSHTAGKLSNLNKHICMSLFVDFLFCIFDQFSSLHTKAFMFW